MKMISDIGENLSIILQGGVFEKNAVEVTHIASEYRKIFPKSEIIFSISSSDFLAISNEKLVLCSSIKNNILIVSAVY